MRKLFLSLALLASAYAFADSKVVSSPDGRLVVTISCDEGKASYAVQYDGKEIVKPSALGLKTNVGDFTKGLKMLPNAKQETLRYAYLLSRSKFSSVSVVANRLQVDFETETKIPMSIIFCVEDNDIAFKYTLGRGPKDNPKCAIVYEEVTAFNLPDETHTFICPQITPMTGWERTKPSYEEDYEADAPMNKKSRFGVGYTFPCLFRIPPVAAQQQQSECWLLISETGVTSGYCGSRLSDYEAGRGYTVAYPQKGENNGFGSEYAGIMLPGETPWRTITMGNSLKPIVETTVQFDFVEPLYEPSEDYQPGRYTWSWLVWQDSATNYDDQVKMIDLASTMGYEYCLVDGLWDTQIGWGFVDYGTFSAQSCDYPDFAHPMAIAIEKGEVYPGIAICGTGNGIAMTLNKHQGIRAALCWKPEICELARKHNDANVLVLPGRHLTNVEADAILEVFFTAEFEGGRHERRVQKIPV